MMRLLRMILVTSLVLILACATSILIGRAQPATEPVPNLTICGAVPCYMGIVPNVTNWDTARDALADDPSLEVNPSQPMVMGTSGPIEYIMARTHGDKTIFAMNLMFRPGYVFAANVVAELGAPCSLHLMRDTSRKPVAILNYRDRSIVVLTDNWRLKYTSPVIEIDLGYTSPPMQTGTTEYEGCRKFGNMRPTEWSGFGRYEY